MSEIICFRFLKISKTKLLHYLKKVTLIYNVKQTPELDVIFAMGIPVFISELLLKIEEVYYIN